MEQKVIPAFNRAGLEFDLLQSCGSVVYAIECQSCNTHHFSGFQRCKSRWCVSCNHVKTLAWIARLIPVIQEWKNNGGYVGKMNFTIRNTETLQEGLDTLGESWRRFSNGKGVRSQFKAKFPGGIRSLEVTIGDDGSWHPHYHTLFLKSEYSKDFDWLKEQWEKASSSAGNTDEKIGSIWLEGFYGTDKKLIKGVIEVVKYITSPESGWFEPHRASHLREAYRTLKGVRQMNAWGLLYGLASKVEEDLETLNEKKLTDFICQNCGCTEGELRRLLYKDNLNLIDLR